MIGDKNKIRMSTYQQIPDDVIMTSSDISEKHSLKRNKIL